MKALRVGCIVYLIILIVLGFINAMLFYSWGGFENMLYVVGIFVIASLPALIVLGLKKR